jgi:hypothetical protein
MTNGIEIIPELPDTKISRRPSTARFTSTRIHMAGAAARRQELLASRKCASSPDNRNFRGRGVGTHPSLADQVTIERRYQNGWFSRTPRYMPHRTIQGITTRSTDHDGNRNIWPVGRKTSSPSAWMPNTEPHRRRGAR